MCGRFALLALPGSIASAFGLPVPEAPATTPRYNIAPSQQLLVLQAGPAWASMRWGLVPSWARDPDIGMRTVNARAETAAEKPSFRAALRARRCLIPADGFYEWAPALPGGKKRPHLFRRADGAPFTFAGLWESWRPAQGDPDTPPLLSCTILTTEANADVAPLHHRMPLILPAEEHAAWLDPARRDATALLAPRPPGVLAAVEVAPYVNDARREGPDCQAPAAG